MPVGHTGKLKEGIKDTVFHCDTGGGAIAETFLECDREVLQLVVNIVGSLVNVAQLEFPIERHHSVGRYTNESCCLCVVLQQLVDKRQEPRDVLGEVSRANL